MTSVDAIDFLCMQVFLYDCFIESTYCFDSVTHEILVAFGAGLERVSSSVIRVTWVCELLFQAESSEKSDSSRVLSHSRMF